MPKNYFAVVHKEAGALLVNSAQLPIYWNKKVATIHAARRPDYIVQPVDAKEMERLILSKPNKKAK